MKHFYVAPQPEERMGERRTLEMRMNELVRVTANLRSTASHIHGILYGVENTNGEPLADMVPSIESTLSDTERNIHETASVLEEIESGLTNDRRLSTRL